MSPRMTKSLTELYKVTRRYDILKYLEDLPVRHAHIDGLVQERHNSIVNTLELHLSWTNPSILRHMSIQVVQLISP